MKKRFTKENLIAFGNYLFSKERHQRTTPNLRGRVTHADVSNFEDTLIKKSGRQKTMKFKNLTNPHI
jgi:hypothetical protein